ncbi:MAG: metallophosphoesterase [Planctomycetota bacterium]|nr:metallophosphoesterase [Planctomycetota bacterium]
MSHPVANTFTSAAELVAEDDNRQGNCLLFKLGEKIIYVGDIHGHRRNLAKVIAHAALSVQPHRRLVLQELIHGGPTDQEGADRSVEVLLRAARLKISYPGQVFFLMANHDISQITGYEILKNGRGECEAFDASLDRSFGQDAEEVRSAIHRLLRNQPLAARCENGLFMTHSLPSPNRMDLIDWDILNRPYVDEDFNRGGTLHEWVWGRDHPAEQLADLAERLEAERFLLGHQPCKTGYQIQHGASIIIDSHHSHGVIMEFDAGLPLDENIDEHIRPIVAL